MFEPKVHQYSIPFDGSPPDAFDLARTALLSLGFEIVTDSGVELRAHGPGMHSNREPPLVGVSDFSLRVGGGTIQASTTLGGVATMTSFVYLFPPGLVLSLWGVSLVAGNDVQWTLPLFVAPWLLIAPFLARGLERRTTRAVESLLRGMAQMKARR